MNYLWLAGILLLFTTCTDISMKKIGVNDPDIQLQGRIDTEGDSVLKMFWPGSSVKIRFRGTQLSATIKDTKGESYYNVIINKDSSYLLRPTKEKKSYTLASLPEGEHTVELFRRTEFPTGTTAIYGFEIDEKAKLVSLEKKQKSIVFYGNSITTGYANEDTMGTDRPDSIFTNNYMAYGAITARHFNADYTCIARGGIGFMVSWHPQIMPELYNRLDPNNKNSEWDFTQKISQIVVVNLGQNDSWILKNPQSPEYKYRFEDTVLKQQNVISRYTNFIETLRNHYPKSNIICALGSMDAVADHSPWPEYIKKAVEKTNDPKVFYFTFPFLAPNGHPRVKDHHIMAQKLIKFIDQHDLWKFK